MVGIPDEAFHLGDWFSQTNTKVSWRGAKVNERSRHKDRDPSSECEHNNQTSSWTPQNLLQILTDSIHGRKPPGIREMGSVSIMDEVSQHM